MKVVWKVPFIVSVQYIIWDALNCIEVNFIFDDM